MRYWDMQIWSMDQAYIDKISDIYDIDYYDCEIEELCNGASLTNKLIYYILYEAVEKLFISNKNRQLLQDNIYCNCLDSWFMIDSSNVDDIFKWTKKLEKNIIKEFLDM